ncbi:hypothetical protein ACYOEI_32555 [Singulisphaera rosea]
MSETRLTLVHGFVTPTRRTIGNAPWSRGGPFGVIAGIVKANDVSQPVVRQITSNLPPNEPNQAQNPHNDASNHRAASQIIHIIANRRFLAYDYQ